MNIAARFQIPVVPFTPPRRPDFDPRPIVFDGYWEATRTASPLADLAIRIGQALDDMEDLADALDGGDDADGRWAEALLSRMARVAGVALGAAQRARVDRRQFPGMVRCEIHMAAGYARVLKLSPLAAIADARRTLAALPRDPGYPRFAGLMRIAGTCRACAGRPSCG